MGGSTGNNFIATAPGHPVLQQMAEDVTRDILNGASESIWLRTGPGAMSRSVVQHLAQTGQARLPDGVHILPESDLLQYLAMACPFSYKQTGLHWQIGEGTGISTKRTAAPKPVMPTAKPEPRPANK